MLGPHATLKESVSDSLVRNTSNLLEVILQGIGSIFHAPSHTKEQVPVLLLGGCPSVGLSSSAHLTVGLLVSPSSSWGCARRHSKHSSILEELDYLVNLTGQQVLLHATIHRRTNQEVSEESSCLWLTHTELSPLWTCPLPLNCNQFHLPQSRWNRFSLTITCAPLIDRFISISDVFPLIFCNEDKAEVMKLFHKAEDEIIYCHRGNILV